MRTAVRELGQTIVMVTHDPVAASYADRVVFLADGRSSTRSPTRPPSRCPRPHEALREVAAMFRLTIKGLWAHKLRFALTGLAVVLGVAFMAGTMILTDTMGKTFDNLVSTTNEGIDARASQRGRRRRVRRVPGAHRRVGRSTRSAPSTASPPPRARSRASPSSSGRRHHQPADGLGVTIGSNWIADERLNPFDLAEGRAPERGRDGPRQGHRRARGLDARRHDHRAGQGRSGRPSPWSASPPSARSTGSPARPWSPPTSRPRSSCSPSLVASTPSSWPPRAGRHLISWRSSCRRPSETQASR